MINYGIIIVLIRITLFKMQIYNTFLTLQTITDPICYCLGVISNHPFFLQKTRFFKNLHFLGKASMHRDSLLSFQKVNNLAILFE